MKAKTSTLYGLFLIVMIINANLGLCQPPNHNEGRQEEERNTSKKDKRHNNENLSKGIPRILTFEKNMGQINNEDVLYTTKDAQAVYFFEKTSIKTVISDVKNEASLGYAIEFVTPSPEVRIEGKGSSRAGQKNYHRGENSYLDVPTSRRLKYSNLWNGVNAIFYEKKKTLKYDFEVLPGTNPSTVQFKMNGVTNLKINKKGELEFTTPLGTLQKGKPYTYQKDGTATILIKSAYKIDGDVVSFEIGEYDTTKTLIIDPVALMWSTFLGGDNTYITDMHVSSTNGNIYLVGRTTNPSHPNTLGTIFNNGNGTSADGFITCLSADGTSILWSTFIGGNDYDQILGIYVDETGDIFLRGETGSVDFPVNGLVPPYDATHNGNYDLVVMRLNNDGTVLKYSTFFGTSSRDTYGYIRSLVVRGDNVYTTTYVRQNSSIPVTAGAYQTTNTADGFGIHCFNTTIGGTPGLLYSTLFTDTTYNDLGYLDATDIDADSAGNIYVLGEIWLEGKMVHTANAVQTRDQIIATSGGNQSNEANFIAKFDPTLSNLLYSTSISPIMPTSNGFYYDSYYNGQLSVDDAGNMYISLVSGIYDINDISTDLAYAPNINQLNLMNPYVLDYDDLYYNTILKIPASNPSQYEFVNIYAGNYSGDWQAGSEIDKYGRIHYFYEVEKELTQSITTTDGALQSNLPIGANSGSSVIYTILSPTGLTEYSTVFGAKYGTNNEPYAAPYAAFISDDCKVYLAGWADKDAKSIPITPTYRDYTTNTQKTIYQSQMTGNGGSFIAVFHEPTPTNTINDFAIGNNTFCVGGLIYQNPNDGPIIGNAAGYISGDGSSSTHNLPDLKRGNTTESHPIPASPALAYQWEKSYDGTNWLDIPGGNLDVLKPDTELSAGTVRYRRKITGTCDTTYSNMATATIAGNFNLQINVPPSAVYFCLGDVVDLGITIDNASGNINWQWYDGFSPLSSTIITPSSGAGTASSFSANIASTATSGGFYRLVVTDAGGCKKEAFVTITPLTASAGTSPSMRICPNSGTTTVTIGPSAVNPDFDYQWTGPGGFTSNLPNPAVSVSGDYYLQVKLKAQGSYCAAGETTVNIPAQTPFDPALTTLPDVGFCQSDPPATIGSNAAPPQGYVFQWTPGANLDDVTLFNPTFAPGLLPFGIMPISDIEYTFTALRLSDGCIFETKLTVSDTAQALAQAGIDKPACGTSPSQNFGATETTGDYFEWSPVATTYPGGLSALTSAPSWRMDGVATTTSTSQFLTAAFPSSASSYTIDFEIKASYVPLPNGCYTRDTVRLYYNPSCGSGIWCSDLTANFEGSTGACSGNTSGTYTWISGSVISGLTYTWTTHSVDGVVQPANTAPRGLFEYNNGAKGSPLVTGAAHPVKAIVDFDDVTWGWAGANVVVYKLTAIGDFGAGTVDCSKTIQVFSGTNASPVVGVIDKSLCGFPAPGTQVGTGNTPSYTLTGTDYTTAPNSSLIWQWSQRGLNTTPFITGNGNTPFPTLDPDITTDFIVKVTDPITGCTAFDTMRMEIIDVIANAGTDVANVCQGSLIQLGTPAVTNHTYSWTPSSGLNFPIGTPNSTTAQPYLTVPNVPTGQAYFLTVTETTTGCQARDSVIVTTTSDPPATPAAAAYRYCGGSTFSMGGTVNGSGLTYSWSAGAGADLAWLNSSFINRPTVTLPSNFTGPATFTLTVTKGTCGSSSRNYTITDNTISINLGPDVTATCTVPLTALSTTAVSGYTYLWLPFDGLFTDANGTIPYTGSNTTTVYALPSTTTTYTLIAEGSGTCIASDDIIVFPPTGTAADAGADKVWCSNGSPITIGNSATGTVTWSAIGYEDTLTNPVATPTPAEAATMMSYLSSSSATSPTFSQPSIAQGIYVYRMTVVNGGCTITDDVTVRVPPFSTGYSGISQSVCLGSSVQLGIVNAPTTYNYSWSAISPTSANGTISNRNIARPFVTPTVNTTYELTYKDLNYGCSAREVVSVTITPSPSISDVSSSPFCVPVAAQDLTSYIPSYSSYFNQNWYQTALPGGSVVNTPTNVPVSTATDFFLVAENQYGCKDTAQLIINVEDPQTPVVQPNAILTCLNPSLDLVDYQGSPSNPNYTLEWHSSNNTLSSSLISNTVVSAIGNYYLFEKSPNGCYSSSGVFSISYASSCDEICDNGIDDDGDGLIDCADDECQPIISNVNATQPTCSNKTSGQIVITASSSSTLEYSITNEASWQTSNTFTNLGIGQYIIRVRNDAGCISGYTSNPIVLDFSTCLEICNNGIDDDGDGKIDCDDPDCEDVGTADGINNN